MLTLLLVACSPVPLWADTIVSAPGVGDGLFSDPELAANGAHGAGCCGGGLDVYGLDTANGRTEIVLAFGEPVFDGPGEDIAVFENPFEVSGGGRFVDPVVVEVSADGESWATFPHAYYAPDPAAFSDDPSHWRGFAGITPVLLNEDDNPVDPADREAAGGDGFDLADLPDGPASQAISASGVHQVRLVPASEVVDPTTGAPFPADPVSNGPDIDAVYGW